MDKIDSDDQESSYNGTKTANFSTISNDGIEYSYGFSCTRKEKDAYDMMTEMSNMDVNGSGIMVCCSTNGTTSWAFAINTDAILDKLLRFADII